MNDTVPALEISSMQYAAAALGEPGFEPIFNIGTLLKREAVARLHRLPHEDETWRRQAAMDGHDCRSAEQLSFSVRHLLARDET